MFKLSETTVNNIMKIAETNKITYNELEIENGIAYMLYGAESIQLKGERYKYLIITPLENDYYEMNCTSSENELELLEESLFHVENVN